MLGLLAALAITILAGASVLGLLQKPLASLDPAERVGVAGLLGLGFLGVIIFLVGLLPGAITFAPLAALPLLFFIRKPSPDLAFKKPEGWGLAALGLFILLSLQALIGVLAPSTSLDWDSLAYHLDVPMKWIEAGQITYIPALHHSNFPLAANALYVPGLLIGGESGAKAFMLCFFLLGGISAFGLARRWSGEAAGWTALLAFGGMPVIAWEAGTAYIDMAHGCFALLATSYAAEAFLSEEEGKDKLLLGGLALGLCLSTKLTGLQVMAGLAGVLILAGIILKAPMKGVKTAALVCTLGLALASPWYIRTFINTGNPVYPFFYSIFGGREWDKWRADIYANEQGTFGVPKSPANLGHAVLGLGYQPGRYTNPGQDQGGGFPASALGFAVVLAALAVLVSGRLERREKLLLAYGGIGLLLWFFLSQQSRYLPILALPIALAAASAAPRLRLPVVQGAFGIQSAATLAILYLFTTANQLPVALGRVSPEEWRASQVPFARAATELNKLPKGSHIVLYDEVFGFLVHHKTTWGNPGHSTIIPHEASQSGADWVAGLRKLGVTHVYINTQYQTPEARERWLQAAGLTPGEAYSEGERDQLWADLGQKWRWLAADAARSGDIQLLTPVGRGLIFALKTE